MAADQRRSAPTSPNAPRTGLSVGSIDLICDAIAYQQRRLSPRLEADWVRSASPSSATRRGRMYLDALGRMSAHGTYRVLSRAPQRALWSGRLRLQAGESPPRELPLSCTLPYGCWRARPYAVGMGLD
jgi:hypothetical protein